ncbi:pentapeptide repeat-containing protein [Neptunicella sp. SCSIO 80796]|uniref:pentapeptide repeat-containing protein n=1 Tax=Neptunicella plasticusilytica TaxID=3117012 RepID=UPI003A4DFADB
MAEILGKQDEYVNEAFNGLSCVADSFDHQQFDSCRFKSCDFNHAVFNTCSFVDCYFSQCNLSLVKLISCKFNNVQFEHCKLLGIDWTQADWSGFGGAAVAFEHCILNNASFFGLNRIEHCKMHDVDFREANFKQASLIGTDLLNSLFNNTNLSKADFTEATNYHIDVFNNNIRQATFSRVEALHLLESLGIKLV